MAARVVTVGDLLREPAIIEYLDSRYMTANDIAPESHSLPVPLVVNLDRKVLRAIETDPTDSLYMGSWHQWVFTDDDKHCGTNHCRAGWAITLAGDAGRADEKQTRWSGVAGAMIYFRSTGRVPEFHTDDDEEALADIVACAMDGAA